MIALIILMLAVGDSSSDGLGIPLDQVVEFCNALNTSTDSKSRPATFADLWNRSDEFRGQPVEVSGRVVKRFANPAIGELPAREEIWLIQGQNLICTVVRKVGNDARIGQDVKVAGIALGQIKYQSGDVLRLAPLVVGAGPPRVLPGTTLAFESSYWSKSSWVVLAIALGLIVMARIRFLKKRPRTLPLEIDHPIDFIS